MVFFKNDAFEQLVAPSVITAQKVGWMLTVAVW